MYLSKFHNALETGNNTLLHEDIEELDPEDPENIMDTLFTSMHSANRMQEDRVSAFNLSEPFA